jgi:hypothetical protein
VQDYKDNLKLIISQTSRTFVIVEGQLKGMLVVKQSNGSQVEKALSVINNAKLFMK